MTFLYLHSNTINVRNRKKTLFIIKNHKNQIIKIKVHYNNSIIMIKASKKNQTLKTFDLRCWTKGSGTNESCGSIFEIIDK